MPTANGSSHAPANVVSTNAQRTLTNEDFARGAVLTRVGTNEVFDFSPPETATIGADWRAFGAASDWIYLTFTNWSVRVAGHEVNRLRIYSFGKIQPLIRQPDGRIATNRWYAPLQTSLGIVPEANWRLLRDDKRPSLFWHGFTPSNTLQLTWQNVLYNRAVETPVSFQADISPSGRCVYRYGLSDAGTELVTNSVVGVSLGDVAIATNCIPANVTSLAFYPLSPEDAIDPDRDGDGLSLADELFVHGTDPELPDSDFDGLTDGAEIALGTNPNCCDTDGDGLVDGSDPDPLHPTSLADLDGDGIPDAYEICWFGNTNAVNTLDERDDTGFALRTKMSAGMNPTNGASSAETVISNSLVAVKLFDAFAADLSDAATNLVWERTFSVSRASSWQQFFLTASPSNAAPWRMENMELEWSTDTGMRGSLQSSPHNDSFRMPLATNDFPSALTLRLRATNQSQVCTRTPIYLLAYVPEVAIGGGQEIAGSDGRQFSVFTKGSDSAIHLSINHSHRPCRAAIGNDEYDIAGWLNGHGQDNDLQFGGDVHGGEISVSRPGVYALPSIQAPAFSATPRRQRQVRSGNAADGGRMLVVLSPSVGWKCRGHGSGYDGLDYDWTSNTYREVECYPLDSPCLRRQWLRRWSGGWFADDCALEVSYGLGEHPLVATSVEGNRGRVFVDGVEVWSGTALHSYGDSGGYHEDFLGDNCDSCATDCAGGYCDILEGASLGSFRFRIPLGNPVQGQVAGFAWMATKIPIMLSADAFRLLQHPDAHISDTTENGVRRIVCTDNRGRDVRIENVANGVRMTIRDAATQRLEHTWELTNVDGDAARIRLRKISRQQNVMFDETFVYTNGHWTRHDNIAGTVTLQQTENFGFAANGVAKRVTRTMTDASGVMLSSVTSEYCRLGERDRAVLRETYREESMGRGRRWTRAEYWNDPAHPSRHGQPRLVWGNGRAWVYTDYDEYGRETLRIEQRGNSAVPQSFPTAIGNGHSNCDGLANAFVNVSDYHSFEGDANHHDDATKVRGVTHYVVTNGVSTLIGRKWHRYTRTSRNGYEAVKCETWRAANQQAARTDADNAYSYTVTIADTGDDTPLLLRGAVAETLDENGILTVNDYSWTNGVLTCVSRKSKAEHNFPTCEVMVRDAQYGNLLRRTTRLTDGDTIIADEQSVYDEKNRLRSTSYLDGTSITNHYSCCRLLWQRDREGRKTLRSAQTGRDHLYHAMEDVWLGEVSTNGQHRITQHFFDALGRETNTVVYAGAMLGEAEDEASANGKICSRTTTSYPHGGSDYAVQIDNRGKTTVRLHDYVDGGIQTTEIVYTNGVEVLRTISRTDFGGGSSVRREWDGEFSEMRYFDEYDAAGRRLAYAITESSDYDTITNRIETYDLLGRRMLESTPSGNTQYVYEGASERIASAIFTAGSVVHMANLIYDDFGEQIGQTTDGITQLDESGYETNASNAVWRVTRKTTVGPSTNALTIVREQLTGFAAGCRKRIETEVKDGASTVETETVDADSGMATEVRTSSSDPEIVRRKNFGLVLEQESDGETRHFSYDAFGRNIRTERTVDGVRRPASESVYDPTGDLISFYTFTNGSDIVAESYAYDAFGRKVRTVNALGEETRTQYDAFGNIVAMDGAAYPMRCTYDTQHRCTSLATTRDGVHWDVTLWIYDGATGLCVKKIYADGAEVNYSHTPDGLPLRTTCASGRWMENVYDSTRQLTGQVFSDASANVFFVRDFYGQIVVSSNANASVVSLLADNGTATNEVWMVAGETAGIVRTLDSHGRIASLSVNGSELHYAYEPNGKLAAISNEVAMVEYAYTADGLDAGYALTLANGTTFTRTLTRDQFRRELVTRIENRVNGQLVENLAYAYDAMLRTVARNNDSFAYNTGGEIASAIIGNHSETHAYDLIGNSITSSHGAITNVYTANNLNQYTSSLRVSAPPRETTFAYDRDGNLLSDGIFSYTYDCANRLASVISNGTVLVANFYDAYSRRVRKVTPTAIHTFIYDGWNLAEERIVHVNGTSTTIKYYWGKDLSGSLQGAGGVGGLLYLTIDGQIFVPCYDNNGNVTKYLDSSGNIVASYTYDAFGNIISQSSALADIFRHRFSTKYVDAETGLCYYGYRFYHPILMRWLNRDPIEENGGENVYCYSLNNAVSRIDALGFASISDYVLSNIGYDRSFPILGPYGLPVPALGSRLQIQIYINGNYAECCSNGQRKRYAKGTVGAEAYLTWGRGQKRRIKGRDRNREDPYNHGTKIKHNPAYPPDSGFRSRSWHVDQSVQENSGCPDRGLHFAGLTGIIFLRGGAGHGFGLQFNIEKEFRDGVDLTSGWSAVLSGAVNVWGAHIDFGGGGAGSWTYLQD